jgi:hypothetical protein
MRDTFTVHLRGRWLRSIVFSAFSAGIGNADGLSVDGFFARFAINQRPIAYMK